MAFQNSVIQATPDTRKSVPTSAIPVIERLDKPASQLGSQFATPEKRKSEQHYCYPKLKVRQHHMMLLNGVEKQVQPSNGIHVHWITTYQS